jgi:cytochrome c
MKKQQLLAALCLMGGLSGPVFANEALASYNNCMACHDVDRKLLGPSFKSVAARYASQKDAESRLARKVLKGGGGVWGSAAMPANQISESDARTLVRWVLSQK